MIYTWEEKRAGWLPHNRYDGVPNRYGQPAIPEVRRR
jgi:hypothetical protein